jgi:hypothetical protein
MLTVVDADGMTPNGSLIDEIVREGARRMLAGDGALGFWKALGEVFPATRAHKDAGFTSMR